MLPGVLDCTRNIVFLPSLLVMLRFPKVTFIFQYSINNIIVLPPHPNQTYPNALKQCIHLRFILHCTNDLRQSPAVENDSLPKKYFQTSQSYACHH